MNAMLNRVYADYLMPSRLGEYEALVREVAAAGYAQLSVRDFIRQVRCNETVPSSGASPAGRTLPEPAFAGTGPAIGIAIGSPAPRPAADAAVHTLERPGAAQARRGPPSTANHPPAGVAAAPAACASGPSFVHRHDIDSDLRTAKKIFAIESRHGVRASYYFRLCTLDYGFMREIEAAGSEAGYHYEEVADFAKRHRLRSAEAVRQRFPEIREQFARNLGSIVERLGLPITTVASHGDFANRRLKVINHELLRDAALRRRCGIECESYDADLLRCFDLYISDRKHPVYYYPVSPFEALAKYRHICLLTHPVQWETNWVESTRCNMRRLVEEVAWRAP